MIPLSTNPVPDAGSAEAAALGDAGPTMSTVSEGSADAQRAPDAPAIPAGSWQNVTSNLAGMMSECGNMTSVTAKPDEDLLIAGVALQGLWGSSDGGGTWTSLGANSPKVKIDNRPEFVVFDPTNKMTYWESGSYGTGGGVYRTDDDGASFVQLGTVWYCDLVSVDFSSPSRSTLLVARHEGPQTLYLSIDGGMTWVNVGGGLPAGVYCPSPLVLDSMTFLVGCSQFGGTANGVYRSTDGGGTWTQVTHLGGGAGPLVASDKSIYWMNTDGTGMIRGSADGQTWSAAVGMGAVTNRAPAELPDGRLVVLGAQYVMVSADKGTTWVPASAKLPYQDAVGLTYSTQEKAFFIWHNDCGNSVLPDAIMRFNFDYQHS